MSLVHNASTVRSGLVLHLDAANPKSYLGSGTTWNSLTGNGIVSIAGTPSFSSLNNGAIVFNTVDDYADFTAPNLGTVASVEMWCKPTSVGGKMFFGWLLYDVFASGGAIGYNTAASDVYGIPSAQVTALGLLNNWAHYVFVMRTDVSYTNNKIYVNGVSQSLSQVTGTEAAGNRVFNSGAGRIGGWRSDANYRMAMDIGVFNVYNKELSAAEIRQNFEALRSRYGI